MSLFPVFSPHTALADNLVTSNLVAHYRADLGVTESGGTISQWDDQTASGWNLTEATNKPTYNASGGPNGQPYIEFNTITDSLSNGSVSVAQGFHMFFCLRQPSWILNGYIFRDSADHPFIDQGQTTPNLKHNGGSAGGNEVSATLNTWWMLQSYFDGASSHQALNDGAESTGTSIGANTMTGLVLGAQAGGADSLGAIYDLAELAIYSAEVTGADLTQNQQHFSQRYSLGF